MTQRVQVLLIVATVLLCASGVAVYLEYPESWPRPPHGRANVSTLLQAIAVIVVFAAFAMHRRDKYRKR